MNVKKTILRSALVLYFVIALEVLIMISPFAGLFYSAFNPVLLKLSAHPSTRWLSAFYLPHMVLLQDWLLIFIRVMGSILFVLGIVIFIVSAAQIYAAKFARKGAVLGGLYSVIRHPQYLSLGIAGLGLAILWPRILTVVLWLFMAAVYYFLAKDEERRMLKFYPGTYQPYLDKTGMFLPKGIEKSVTPSTLPGKFALSIALASAVLGGTFLLRAYTISHLTLWTKSQNVTGIAILPEDGLKMEHRMDDILALEDVQKRMSDNKQYLVYFIPRDYIMQGMIADTGEDWQLYKQHHAISMITDLVFHPFRHLREGHHAVHGGMHEHNTGPDGGMIRRLIFLSVEGAESGKRADLFGINAVRVPEFMIDMDIHNLMVIDAKELEHKSGWGSVPTPMF